MLALALLLTVTAILFWFLVRSERHPPSKEPALRRSPGRLPETQRWADGKEEAKSSIGHR
jgi:hypothetical protein